VYDVHIKNKTKNSDYLIYTVHITVNTYLFKYVPVKSGLILSIIGVLRIPEESYLYKDKDKVGCVYKRQQK